MKKQKRADRVEPASSALGDADPLGGLLDDAAPLLADFIEGAAPVKPPRARRAISVKLSGREEMEAVFLGLVQNTLRPLTRYFKALRKGEQRPELYEIVDLIASPAAIMAERSQLPHLSAALGDLGRRCREASAANGSPSSAEEHRREVLALFQQVQRQLDLSYRGHQPAVMNLLRFYTRVRSEPAVEAEDIRRFFSLGIPSVSWICRTPEPEMQSLCGASTRGVRLMKVLARRSQRKTGFGVGAVDISRLLRLTTRF